MRYPYTVQRVKKYHHYHHILCLIQLVPLHVFHILHWPNQCEILIQDSLIRPNLHSTLHFVGSSAIKSIERVVVKTDDCVPQVLLPAALSGEVAIRLHGMKYKHGKNERRNEMLNVKCELIQVYLTALLLIYHNL